MADSFWASLAKTLLELFINKETEKMIPIHELRLLCLLKKITILIRKKSNDERN